MQAMGWWGVVGGREGVRGAWKENGTDRAANGSNSPGQTPKQTSPPPCNSDRFREGHASHIQDGRDGPHTDFAPGLPCPHHMRQRILFCPYPCPGQTTLDCREGRDAGGE